MEPPPSLAKLARAALLPAGILIAVQAYQIANSPPDERRRQIAALLVVLLTIGVIIIFTLRKWRSSPENPRLSRFTVAGITLVLILLAVLFRNL